MNQDSISRFTEVGGHIWNMWAKEVFKSCARDNFHPLLVIPDEEWQAEEQRIEDLPDHDVRARQAENLAAVKELRQEQLKVYQGAGGHGFAKAFSEATKTLKCLGVSLLSCI